MAVRVTGSQKKFLKYAYNVLLKKEWKGATEWCELSLDSSFAKGSRSQDWATFNTPLYWCGKNESGLGIRPPDGEPCYHLPVPLWTSHTLSYLKNEPLAQETFMFLCIFNILP